jgi:pimeloyl-ACP methyl ester carboxylesterase
MAALIWLPALIAAAATLGVTYQFLGTRRDRRLHPPPGRLVDVGSHRLHLVESGEGDRPTIVFEAGLMSTCLSWRELQAELSAKFRVVSYDRAGMGWSEMGPMPRTADRITEELHELLLRARIAPPYVLVGHSFGGLTMQVFASRYPHQVAGVVLVDPVGCSEWNPATTNEARLIRVGAAICRRAGFLARFGILRFVAFLLTTKLSSLAGKAVTLISRGAPRESGSVSSPWFQALPEQEKAMARVFWVQSKFALTIASQLENLPVTSKSAGAQPIFTDKPVIVLSAANVSHKRRQAHAEMVAQLPHGKHLVAQRGGHWLMQEEPELVIAAIREVSMACRISQATAGAWQFAEQPPSPAN